MMEGLYEAGWKMTPSQKEKIVRVLNTAGQQHLVLKALQRAAKTDLRLDAPGVVHRAFSELLKRAKESDWEKTETEKMFSFAEQYAELMETKDHLGKHAVEEKDPRTSPVVIGCLVALAAKSGEQDKLERYTRRLMDAVRQRNSISVCISRSLHAAKGSR